MRLTRHLRTVLSNRFRQVLRSELLGGVHTPEGALKEFFQSRESQQPSAVLMLGVERHFRVLIDRTRSDDLPLLASSVEIILDALARILGNDRDRWVELYRCLSFGVGLSSGGSPHLIGSRPLLGSIDKNKAMSYRHILFVTEHFPAKEHAGGLRFFDLIQEFHARGYRVSLYSSFSESTDSESYQILSSMLSFCRLVPVNVFSNSDFEPWLDRVGLEFSAVHFAWPRSALLIAPARRRGLRTVFEMAESTVRRGEIDLELKLRELAYEELGQVALQLVKDFELESLGVHSADEVVALTERDADFARQLFRVNRPHIVPTGISDFAVWQRIKNNAKNTSFGPQAVFLGYYGHYPNLDALKWFLKNVYPKVLALEPAFEFVILGRGPLDWVKENYGRDPNVKVLGEVDDFIPHLVSSRVCLSPLVSGAGFRGKLNQYSAVRRPTVSTSIGACGTVYQHGKDVMIADDPEQFARYVVDLIRDDALHARISEAAYQTSRREYSWEPHVKRLEEIYVGNFG